MALELREGAIHVVVHVVGNWARATKGRRVEGASDALHEGHTHELLSSVANVLGDPRVVGASVAEVTSLSVSD